MEEGGKDGGGRQPLPQLLTSVFPLVPAVSQILPPPDPLATRSPGTTASTDETRKQRTSSGLRDRERAFHFETSKCGISFVTVIPKASSSSSSSRNEYY